MEVAAVARRFDDALPLIAELRNMLEHEDDYLVGTGDKQAGFVASVRTMLPVFGPGTVSAAASGT